MRAVQGPTMILGDNRATDILVNKEGSSSRSRHFERATVYIKYAVMKLIMKLFLVPTSEMVADIFTKPTDQETFVKMRDELHNTNNRTTNANPAVPTSQIRRLVAALSRVVTG